MDIDKIKKSMKSKLLLILLFCIIFNFSIVIAQENDGILDIEEIIDLDELEEDVGEISGAGTTPDSALYFLDEFFDRFGDDLKVREEKVAEIKAMVEEGNLDAAREALKSYRKRANELKNEIDPDLRDDARKSAARIRNALKDIENNLGDEEKEEFIDDILDSEVEVLTSVEISSKIKELCVQLSSLDPLEYDRVCNTNDDVPEWKKRLHEDLTDEQEKEAREFGQIMSECFKSSGVECRCEDIGFAAMSEMCIVARPLAVACDVENDESACEELDSLEMPELPDYLEDVLDEIENKFNEDSFDHHIPGPCRDAGITGEERGDREACFEIMIENEAPPECRDALREANIRNEREAREICEKIMFELDAPQECLDSGITDHRECGRLMFKINEPPECIKAGLTGDGRDDHRKCENIVGDLDRGFDGRSGRGHGPPGADCLSIQDDSDRLRCFENAVSGFDEFRDDYREDYRDDFEERFRETKNRERKCAQTCHDKGQAWDFSYGDCRCFGGDEFRDDYKEFEDHYKERFDYSFDEEKIEECKQDGGRWYFEGNEFKCDKSGPSGEIDYILKEELIEECERDGGRWYWEDSVKCDKSDYSTGIDCSVIDCQQGYYCKPDYGCVYDSEIDFNNDYEFSECKDGCDDECPGASRTECVEDGTKCKCHYEDETSDEKDHIDTAGTGDGDSGTDNSGSDGGDGSGVDDITGSFVYIDTGNGFLDYLYSK